MENGREVTWGEDGAKEYIKLENEKPTQLSITNWKLLEIVKNFNGRDELKVEFFADVVKHDGKKVEKKFSTISNRLKAKLRPILEGKDNSGVINLRITRVGESYGTHYMVEEGPEFA